MKNDRLVNQFIEMAKISSPSLKEREMADYLKKKLETMGFSVEEDETGEKINGNAGNVTAVLPATGKFKDKKEQIMFSAHMDTVTPCDNIIPLIKDGMITSSGNSILGADDKAGIAAVIEAVASITENAVEHPEILFIFSVAEEIRLLGAANLDTSKLNVKYGFILDSSGKPGTVVKRAPYHEQIILRFLGKAAHAGIEPEKGINALYVAACALAKLKVGRIDEETTFNPGIVSGGRATNIVMEKVEIRCEARSFSVTKLGNLVESIIEICRNTCEELGAQLDYEVSREYDGFDFDDDSEIITIVKNAAKSIKLPFEAQSLGGGSDTNVYNAKGINTVNLGIGMSKPHSLDEFIEIRDLEDTAKLVIEIIKEASKKI